MAERKDFLKGKKAVTFLDLFAGDGGISEGFLQAYTKNKYFKSILASDINENCELTPLSTHGIQFYPLLHHPRQNNTTLTYD